MHPEGRRQRRGSSAACCSRRSTGATTTRPPRASARWWRRSPIRSSGQPENKATPASIAPYEYVFRGFALSRTQLELPEQLWWTRVTVTGGYGYLFADNADLARWQSWLRSASPARISPNTGISAAACYRAASFAGDRIETCLFVGPAHDAGDWEVVKGLFAAESARRRPAPHAAVRQIQRRASPAPARSSAPASASAAARSATPSRPARARRPRSARN